MLHVVALWQHIEPFLCLSRCSITVRTCVATSQACAWHCGELGAVTVVCAEHCGMLQRHKLVHGIVGT